MPTSAGATRRTPQAPGMAQRSETQTGSYLKYLSLLVLTFQNALLIISMRYTRVQKGDMYFTTTAVVISESLKMVICLIIIFFQKKTFSAYVAHLYESIIVNWEDTLKMSVPAIVYMVQNNLQYVAVSNLDAAVFQVSYQMKILTTALFSVLMLNRKLSVLQWGSLVILFTGVALVQFQSTSESTSTSAHQNQWVGLVAVLISCLSSGFAGVYFEKMLKGSSASLWLRNVQLGLFGSMTAVIGMLVKDGAAIYDKGYFFGYTPLVFFVVAQQALGGLIVAVVVRYADNILKGFATSLSIILSCIAAVFLFNYSITILFTIGAALVILAIYLYGRPQKPEPKTSPPPGLPVTINTSKTSPGNGDRKLSSPSPQ